MLWTVHLNVTHGIVWRLGIVLQLDVGHTHYRARAQKAEILGMHYFDRHMLCRAEEQMARVFNDRCLPAPNPREHLQPVPLARRGLSP